MVSLTSTHPLQDAGKKSTCILRFGTARRRASIMARIAGSHPSHGYCFPQLENEEWESLLWSVLAECIMPGGIAAGLPQRNVSQ